MYGISRARRESERILIFQDVSGRMYAGFDVAEEIDCTNEDDK
jgi:hypothetical protein